LGIQQLVEETSDQIILEKLLKRGRSQKEETEEGEVGPGSKDSASTSSDPLALVRVLLKNAVLTLKKFEGPEQAKNLKESDAYKTLSDLADWVVLNWAEMSEHVRSSRAVFDLCK
jgi:hypothetical protein